MKRGPFSTIRVYYGANSSIVLFFCVCSGQLLHICSLGINYSYKLLIFLSAYWFSIVYGLLPSLPLQTVYQYAAGIYSKQGFIFKVLAEDLKCPHMVRLIVLYYSCCVTLHPGI